MTTKLIGYSERKTGVYEGREYDNINLQTICDSFDDITGWGCSVLKVKFPKLPQMLGCSESDVYVHFDNRQMIQILYHLLSVVSYSKYTSEEMKKALLTPELCDIANKFHRVNECGKILPMDFSE